MMTETYSSQPRALNPRKLEQQETLQTLNHWKTVFRNFYRRCQYYSIFLLPTTTWDNSADRGLPLETTGLKRDQRTLASDLDGFLDCVASYLPFDYVAEKLRCESNCIQKVWEIIYELYDAEINTTNYLDYASMSRDPDETYRNYFNRLVGFVRQHLPTEAYEAEGVRSPATGETMTIALLDSIAVHWLNSIDRRLVNIIKTEFSTDLKTKRLCQLVKPISKCIDELIARNSQKEVISSVSSANNPSPRPPTTDPSIDAVSVDMLLARIENLESGRFMSARQPARSQVRQQASQPFRGARKPFSQTRRRPYCTHCSFINRQLGSSLKTDHSSTNCGKQHISVNMVEALDDEEKISPYGDDETLSSYDEGDHSDAFQHSTVSLQRFNPAAENISKGAAQQPSDDNMSNSLLNKHVLNPINCAQCHLLSVPELTKCNQAEPDSSIYATSSEEISTERNTGKIHLYDQSLPPSFIAALKNEHKYSPLNNLDKAKSPRLQCMFNNESFTALIDSGAEVNVLDKSFAVSLGLGIINTTETALAANKLPLEIFGQTAKPFVAECITKNGNKMLHLGIVLVIANLGVSCIIGEPGKTRNNIICLPKQKIILLASENDVHQVPYSPEDHKYTLARAKANLILAPGEEIKFQLPDSLKLEEHLAVTPRAATSNWLQPSIVQPASGYVYLINSSQNDVPIQCGDHLADIRCTKTHDLKIRPLPDILPQDNFQYSDFSVGRDPNPDLSSIQVDPDNVLQEEDRMIFHNLHKRFAQLFTKQPGRYNGKWGFIENRLQFSTPPPPNNRTHIPNYSPSMNAILAEKMDLLEAWGILIEPERAGVQVEFVSPSMLVPKPDKG